MTSKNDKPLLYQTLRVLFKLPVVVLMLGDWRTGKTDTSLLIGALSKKWRLIDKIGSNIWTFNSPEVEYITNTRDLKKWLHGDKRKKLFIFDEALCHIPRRGAMSHKNISILKLLAELSKGHARMIFCSQLAVLDKDIMNPAFTRAVFFKRSKKVMECRSKHFPPRLFTGLPRSPIKFDPDRLAPFIDIDVSKDMELISDDRIYEIVEAYIRLSSYKKTQNELGVHPEEIRRGIRSVLKWYLNNVWTYPEEKRPKMQVYERKQIEH